MRHHILMMGLLILLGIISPVHATTPTPCADCESDIQTMLLRGIKNREAGRYWEAIADFTAIIDQHPTRPQAYFQRGAIYHFFGTDYQSQAIADLDMTIQLNPTYPHAHTLRGAVYADMGEFDLAQADFDEALRQNPQDVDVYRYRGFMYYTLADYPRAVADYTEAIRIAPTLNTQYNRGIAYYDMGEYDRALADFIEITRQQPKFSSAYYYQGRIYLDSADYANAVTAFSEAIRLQPSANRYYHRALAYEGLGQYDLARTDYQQSIHILDNGDAHVRLGIILLQADDYMGALQNFKQVFLYFTDYLSYNIEFVRYLIVITYMRLNDYESAGRVFIIMMNNLRYPLFDITSALIRTQTGYTINLNRAIDVLLPLLGVQFPRAPILDATG